MRDMALICDYFYFLASVNSWTGWAVSSFTSKFYKTPKSQATPTSGDTETKETSAEAAQREKSAPAKGINSSSEFIHKYFFPLQRAIW